MSGSNDKSIKLWDNNGNLYNVFTGHSEAVLCMIQLNDGRIASCSIDKTIKIWNYKKKSEKPEVILIGHTAAIFCILQLKDGRLLSSSGDKTLRFWDLSKGICEQVLEIPKEVECMIQLKDGNLVTGGYDGKIRIYKPKKED